MLVKIVTFFLIGMAILAMFQIEELVGIIMASDVKSLIRVPGIGAKKAEKLLLELKGRVDRLSVGIEPAKLAAMNQGGAADDPIMADAPDAVRDAVAALEALFQGR